jgi:N-acetylmuramoyl-L-alanine amidase
MSRSVQIPQIQADLAAIGYECPATGMLDEDTGAAIAAFQRHFRPARISGVPDGETAALAALLAREFERGPAW